MNVFPPLTWARKGLEWLAEKPESQWTLGTAISKSKMGAAMHIPSMTLPMSRGARFAERVMFAKELMIAAPLLLAHPLALPVVVPLLFNAKCNAAAVGAIIWGTTKLGAFLAEAYDQILNGPDEFREGEKYAKAMKKRRKGLQPNQQYQPAQHKPSFIEKLVEVGKAFNSNAGKPITGQPPMDPLQGPVIWGSAPGMSNQYEQPLTVPSEDAKRIASEEAGESVKMHNMHYGPQPGHHGGG